MRKGDLIHELANPAQIVAGMLRRLRVIADSEVIEKEKLASIVASLERASRRISELLQLYRGKPLSRRAVRVAEILEMAADAVRLQHPDKVAIVVQVEDADRQIHCDPLRMVQVLVNLLNNAVEASPQRSPCISISAHHDGAVTRISVEDEGAGIAPSLRDQIFAAGFSTKGSTGLGLAISREICAEENASLELDPSAPHTRFVIQLPFTQENS